MDIAIKFFKERQEQRIIDNDRYHIDHRNRYGMTKLMISVERNQITTLKNLLSEGANPNVSRNNSRYITALTIAVGKNRVECVKELIRAGACFNCEQGLEALKMARDHNFLDAVVEGDEVLNSDPDIFPGKTAVFASYKNKCFDLMVELVKAGVTVDIMLLELEDFARTDIFTALTSSPKINLNKRNQKGETILMKAVQLSATQIVQRLIEKHVDIEIVDHEGNTALHFANGGKSDIAKLLLDAGAKVDNYNAKMLTPLQAAANKSDLETMKLLIAAGADVNCTDSYHCTPLMNSVISLDVEVVQILLDHGADVNAADNDGLTPLIWSLNISSYRHAIKKTNTQGASIWFRVLENTNLSKLLINNESVVNKIKFVMELLLRKGTNVSAGDKEGNTCLHLAAEYFKTDVLGIITSQNIDVNVKNKIGQTPLMKACLRCNVEAVEFLLNNGANVFLIDESGNTALHHTVKHEQEMIELVVMLVSHGDYKCVQKDDGFVGETQWANTNFSSSDVEKQNVTELLSKATETPRKCLVNMKNIDEINALHIACSLGHINIVKFLLKENCDCNVVSNKSGTALMIALQHNKLTVADILLENKADINIHNRNGDTALHVAVRYSLTEAVRQLVLSGAKVNAQNSTGNTPLFAATNYQVSKFLIDKNSNVNLRNNNGETTLHHCAGDSLTFLLIESGAELDVASSKGHTPLMYAVDVGDVPKIKWLVEHGANVNVQDCDGRNAFMHAVVRERNTVYTYIRLEMCQYLAENGSDVNVKDVNGQTACMLAVGEDFDIMLETLVTVGADLNILDNENRSVIVHTLLKMKSKKIKRVEKLLEKGAHLVIHENHRYLLKQFFPLEYSNYEATKRMHKILAIGRDSKVDLFKFFLVNGIVLSHSVNIDIWFSSGYMYDHNNSCVLSNIDCAIQNGKLNFVRYFFGIGYLFKSDLMTLRRYLQNKYLKNITGKLSIRGELAAAVQEPWPLVKLAFIEVSTLLGTGPMREEKLKQTKLPPRLQRTLMFQEPISRLPVDDWSKIPLCFDPVQYETLPCPRPLLYYWPVGHRLVN